MDREEEKDLYIKSKIKDGHIPEKIDDLFNNSAKLIENIEQPKKNKNNIIIKRISAVAACVVIALGGGNIYASTQGYDNVFFMIKEWVAPSEEAQGKDEILLDRDITISYKSIEVAKGIKMQINRLFVKDNEAKLYIKIDQSETELDITPFTYMVRDEDGKEICNYTSKKQEMIYTEELKLEGLSKDAKKLELEVQQRDDTTLVKFNIDLEDKEIQVIGNEYELQKISEEELKKYLGAFAFFNYEDDTLNAGTVDEDILENERNMFVAKEIANVRELKFYNGKTTMGMHEYELIDTEIANEIIKSFTDIELEEDGLVKLWNTYFTKSEIDGEMRYVDMPNPDMTITSLCIDVKDIMYSNGIYTVTFTYCYPTTEDIDENRVEDLPVYEMTIGLTINDDQTYSKYRVSSKMEGQLIKEGKEDNESTSDNGEIVEESSIKNTEAEKLVGEWIYSAIQENGKEISFTDVFGSGAIENQGRLSFYEDGTFINTLPGVSTSEVESTGSFSLSGTTITLKYNNKIEKLTYYAIEGTIEQTYDNYVLTFTREGANNQEDNTIKESLIGTWWRSYNVDHEEEYELNLQIKRDGTFVENTMQEADENGIRLPKENGKGTYKIIQEGSWDIVELTYDTGEVHKLLYGQIGTTKTNETKLHYSAGQQVFKKFVTVQ